jgi:hypothetical protein
LFAVGLVSSQTQAAEVSALIGSLDDATKARDALEQLVAMRDTAVPELLGCASKAGSLTRRGWCISALSRIGGTRVDAELKVLQERDPDALVRTWAAAARVHVAPNLEAVLALAPLAAQYPAIQRPLSMRIMAEVGKTQSDPAVILPSLLTLMQQVPQLQQALMEQVMGYGPKPLLATMLSGKDMQARIMAASYVATLGQKDREGVAKAVLEAFTFRAGAKDVPWAGGPLYIPSIQYTRDDATELVTTLLAWLIYSNHREKAEAQQQIMNNLRSVGLMGMAGIGISWNEQTVDDFLRTYQRSLGRAALEKLLERLPPAETKKYRPILEEK